MPCVEFTSTQVQLLKARATRFSHYKQQKVLSAEHGTLGAELDQCLVYGLVCQLNNYSSMSGKILFCTQFVCTFYAI